MFFVALHKPYRGNVDETLIRADLILEVTTRRVTRKDKEHAAPEAEDLSVGELRGTWLLVDRIGWTPCVETPAEVAEAIVTAEVAYRARLAGDKAP